MIEKQTVTYVLQSLCTILCSLRLVILSMSRHMPQLAKTRPQKLAVRISRSLLSKYRVCDDGGTRTVSITCRLMNIERTKTI